MKLKWKVLLIIVLLYVFGIVGVGWHTYGATDPSKAAPSVETIKVIFIMLGGLGIILPTYLNIWQSLETARLLDDEARRSRIENTFSILAKWDDKSLLDARRFTRELKDQHNELSANQLKERIKSTPELRESAILLFNYFELIRISIEHDRVAQSIIKETLGPVAVDICKRFDPWVQEQLDRADVEKFVKLMSS